MDTLEPKPIGITFKRLKMDGFQSGAQETRPFPEVVEKEVRQNLFQEEVIEPGDGRVHLLHTKDRIGCDSSLLLTIEGNGREHVVLTHYDPQHVNEHIRLLKERIFAHPDGKRFAVLLTRSDVGDKWREEITSVLQEYLNGSDPDIVALPNLGVEEAKEIANPAKMLNYQLCFTRGFGGEMQQHRVSVPKGNYDKRFRLK